jgi:hypothetical protein
MGQSGVKEEQIEVRNTWFERTEIGVSIAVGK